MLRIVTEQHDDTYTVSLYGRLAGEWVGLLDRYWQTLLGKVPAAKVTAVLSDVSFIDADGERLLARMWRRGSDIVGCGCMNRHVIEQVKAGARRSATIAVVPGGREGAKR